MNQRLINDIFRPFRSEKHLLAVAPGFWAAILYLLASILLGEYLGLTLWGEDHQVSGLITGRILWVILFYLFMKKYYKEPFKRFQTKMTSGGEGYLIILFPMFFITTYLFYTGFITLFPLNDIVLKEALGARLNDGSSLKGLIFLIVIIAPVVEEILFRGFLLRGFTARYGAKWAILLSAILFSLIHMNPAQMPNTFILGLVLGAIMLRTGNILIPILYHILNNSIPAIGLVYASNHSDKIDALGSETLDISIFTAIAAIVFGLLFLYLILKWFLYLVTQKHDLFPNDFELTDYFKTHFRKNVLPSQYFGKVFFFGFYEQYQTLDSRFSNYGFLDQNLVRRVAADGGTEYLTKLLRRGHKMLLFASDFNQLEIADDLIDQITILVDDQGRLTPD